jgi:hypothetical protein
MWLAQVLAAAKNRSMIHPSFLVGVTQIGLQTGSMTIADALLEITNSKYLSKLVTCLNTGALWLPEHHSDPEDATLDELGAMEAASKKRSYCGNGPVRVVRRQMDAVRFRLFHGSRFRCARSHVVPERRAATTTPSPMRSRRPAVQATFSCGPMNAFFSITTRPRAAGVRHDQGADADLHAVPDLDGFRVLFIEKDIGADKHVRPNPDATKWAR